MGGAAKGLKAENRPNGIAGHREQGGILPSMPVLSPCLVCFSCPGKHWRHRSDGNEQHLRVKRVFLHPLYDPNTFENDMALVELLESAVLSDFVMPICLPQGPPQEGTLPQPEPHPCRAAGASMGMSPHTREALVPTGPAASVCGIPRLPPLQQLSQKRIQAARSEQAGWSGTRRTESVRVQRRNRNQAGHCKRETLIRGIGRLGQERVR